LMPSSDRQIGFEQLEIIRPFHLLTWRRFLRCAVVVPSQETLVRVF